MPRMLPEDIRYWREIQGASQQHLADLLNRHHQTVACWETGRIPVPEWLFDWLEHMEFQIGAGQGVPRCPSTLAEINQILYGSPRKLTEADRKRQEARDARQARKAARDARTGLRKLRQVNSEALEQSREDPNRYHPQLTRSLNDLPIKPVKRPVGYLRGSDDEKMRAMARQLRLRYGHIPPLTKK